MADPLSITASIVAVLQLAQQVVSLCLSYRDAAKSNGGVLQQLLDEVESLTDILDPLAKLAGDHGGRKNSIQVLSKLAGAIEDCGALLGILRAELESVLIARGVKKLGKVLAWPIKEKEVQSLLNRLNQRKLTLALALHHVEMYVHILCRSVPLCLGSFNSLLTSRSELSQDLGTKVTAISESLLSSRVGMKSGMLTPFLYPAQI